MFITLNKGLLPKSERLCKHLMCIEIIQEPFWMSNLIWSTCTVPSGQAPPQSCLIRALLWNLKVGNVFPSVRKFSLKCELWAHFFHRALISHCMTTVPHVILFQFETLPNYLFILLKGENSPSSAFLWRLISTRETLLIRAVWFAVLLNSSRSQAIPLPQSSR